MQISAAPPVSSPAKVDTFPYRAANHSGVPGVPQALQPRNVPAERNRGVMEHPFTAVISVSPSIHSKAASHHVQPVGRHHSCPAVMNCSCWFQAASGEQDLLLYGCPGDSSGGSDPIVGPVTPCPWGCWWGMWLALASDPEIWLFCF